MVRQRVTVKDLIAKLSEFDPDLPVIAYGEGYLGPGDGYAEVELQTLRDVWAKDDWAPNIGDQFVVISPDGY